MRRAHSRQFPLTHSRAPLPKLGGLLFIVALAVGCSRSRALASAATPPQPPAVEFIGEWGTAGSDPGQLNDPVGPAVDDSGRVFLADRGTESVDKFEANGVPLLSFEDPSIRGTDAISVDYGGGIYLADLRVGTMRIFFPEGDFLRAFHIAPQRDWAGPFRFSVDEGGKVFVPDPAGGRIVVLDSHGKLERAWKVSPASAGAPSRPSMAVAAPDGAIYVGDWQAGRIVKYSSEGAPMPGWQDAAAPAAPLLGLAVSSKFLFALRDAAPRLQIWTLDGRLKMSDDLGGRLDAPSPSKASLGVNPSGDLVVLNPAGPRILRFRIHLDSP